jgi:hypothetical protein
MIDTSFAVTGKKLTHAGTTFTIKSAGIKNYQPYAEVEPHDEHVVKTIVNRIQACLPFPFSLDDVQNDLVQ